jgi:hypothetical protein
MFQALRKRIHVSPATAIATLALVFAMTGGAYAASKYVITSTKQISPKVLKSLKGAKGANGTNGTNGANGAAGPAGPTGPAGGPGTAGTNGTNGTNGTSVTSTAIAAPACTNKEGGSEFTAGSTKTFACNGKEGSPWTAGGTLPKGASEKGVWSQPQAIGYPTLKAQFVIVPISFTIPLAAEIEESKVHFIEPGGPLPTGCKGGPEKPEAESGYLCVFASVYENIKAQGFKNPEQASGPPTAGKTGTLMSFELGEEAEQGLTARGTWAVTG